MTEFLKVLLFVLVLCKSHAENVNPRYYPRYHLAPPFGWMNDPNGFSVFNNKYHLFYQYNPLSSLEPGYAHWGHAKSDDLMTWEHLPIAMYPDESYDINGVFSGSAIIENDIMYLFYTGNVNHPDESPDHEQHQCLAISTDGVNVTKHKNNPIIKGEDLQPNFRDPKVWKHKDTYYMVLGHSVDNTQGQVLLFTSQDMFNWDQAAILAESDGSLGYMWECPDFFELDGRFVLLFSPQGIEPQGDKYNNLYQTGYIVGSFDYETNEFTPETEFKELDHGHDFYATQTIDHAGRRLMFAWMDMWEQVYPEREDGFTGQMTLPRVLSLTPEGDLIQTPADQVFMAKGMELYRGTLDSDVYLNLDDNTGYLTIESLSKVSHLEVVVEIRDGSSSPVSITYSAEEGTVTLDRGGEDGIRRTEWTPSGDKLFWRIFIDASSIELFCGEGEVTFSSRFFPDGQVSLRLGSLNDAKMTVSSMRRTSQVLDDNNII